MFKIQFTSHACSNSVYTFKSRLNLGLSFFSFSENTYRAVNLRRRAHVYNGTRPGYFQIINASQLKAKRKTRRKKVSRVNIPGSAHLHTVRFPGGFPVADQMMKDQ
ncbi:Hypothetical_protein [Hexamita inflata]|uniref:Hypothetical_protein n=1 Tax=Hexamita inflata TaxID=28002 RepID=A0AA86TZ86_9EUKA|nr:Hypothetical protein HINF_LOCUS21687 [Hexamita inflata]CAI9934046.1 Hypothetical protein HINF_LOCUS21691 [Hexamita inflata]CAI9935461.1 Hypothetical protein HINF_LOCUS23106 [Hexamita inflata]CAI9935465.1 Hypothetical protein HINF_LOCUS23110 [Hexamita inflata]